MRRLLEACFCLPLILLIASTSAPNALADPARPLQIYAIDVEGGQATLLVSPSGESLLIDTGWPGFNGRDADRIADAAKSAGVSNIDYLLITHYHRDHVGGVPQLAARMKIGTFVDHGPNKEDSDVTREDFSTYERVVGNARRLIVKPGDEIPIKGITVHVLTAAGERIAKPLPRAGQANPFCASEPQPEPDATENARSVGVLITYGAFRFVDLGDLTKKKELELVCPKNLIGTVDLYLVTHHGFNQSNAKAIVQALHPRVAIMDNGPHKGGSPEAWQTVHSSPGLEDLWQLHYAGDAGKDHNVADSFIANLDEKADAGKYIKISADRSGTFTVLNLRNSYKRIYKN